MEHLTMVERSVSANQPSLAAIIADAAAGHTPEEPEFLGSWLPSIPDSQFEIVACLVGDNGVVPALAGLTDMERRYLLSRVATHLRSLQ